MLKAEGLTRNDWAAGCIGENWYSYLRGRHAPEYGSVDIPVEFRPVIT